MVSRADLIAELKSHNIRGSLSKMNRSKLLELRDGLDEAVLDEGASLQPMSGATPSRKVAVEFKRTVWGVHVQTVPHYRYRY